MAFGVKNQSGFWKLPPYACRQYQYASCHVSRVCHKSQQWVVLRANGSYLALYWNQRLVIPSAKGMPSHHLSSDTSAARGISSTSPIKMTSSGPASHNPHAMVCLEYHSRLNQSRYPDVQLPCKAASYGPPDSPASCVHE